MGEFEVKCKKCGSINCEVKTTSDYHFNGENEVLEVDGVRIECLDCYNYKDINIYD